MCNSKILFVETPLGACPDYAQYYAHPVHLPVLTGCYDFLPNPLRDSDLSRNVTKHRNPAKLLILRASLLRNQQVAGSIPAGGSTPPHQRSSDLCFCPKPPGTPASIPHQQIKAAPSQETFACFEAVALSVRTNSELYMNSYSPWNSISLPLNQLTHFPH